MNCFVNARFILIFLLFSATFVNNVSFAEAPVETSKVRISMEALKAANIAMVEFEREQSRADSKNFHVIIEEMAETFEIHFVPNLGSIKEKQIGDMAYIEVQSGGRNENGREIYYVLSKKNLRILKTFYPR